MANDAHDASDLSEDDAKDMLARLAAHYGEPVKPISEYCRAFRVWQGAVEEAARREGNSQRKAEYEAMVLDIRRTSLHVVKSNLLARLLYQGEQLRTEPCPIHLGRWFGCVWDPENQCPHCMSGDNVTGWVATP